MEFYKINDKTVSKDKIMHHIDKILTMRSLGSSQAEVANCFNIDRTFISRIETLGEIRKGKKVALIGFPIANIEEVEKLSKSYGVNYTLLLSEKQRYEFLTVKHGLELFNNLIDIVAEIRTYDTVILIGSDMRINLLESLLDGEIIGIEIGESPIKEDVVVDLEKLEEIMKNLK
ncbi:transcriptional regulator [Alkalicella caledoniensis]|uniref:Transcriptional regulator n=1 Tax=Alkalicella caledoniensis TaxID=2731377 RepID=A0A7G9W824_ALKCA|nr:transcriptional regulator [Alkalicella caledoniensis]QNO14836.1 transcriptional regulator [Alkalicella caledoniensis]